VKLYASLVRKNEQKKRILEIPRKENLRIPLDMGRDMNAGRAGRGGNSGRGGRGRGGCGRGASATVPRKASEVGVCKDLEGHIFTIGSGNKGKDGDMLRTSMEKWLPTLVPSMAMKLPRNGPAERRSLSPSLSILKPYGIGMRQGSKRPESELSYGSRV